MGDIRVAIGFEKGIVQILELNDEGIYLLDEWDAFSEQKNRSLQEMVWIKIKSAVQVESAGGDSYFAIINKVSAVFTRNFRTKKVRYLKRLKERD